MDHVPKVLRLQSIKSRIVGLAVLATLIPSLVMAWVSYAQSRAVLTEKISDELQSVATQTAREIDIWFKERLYDVRIFASSYEVTENIERARRPAGGGPARARLNDYLTSVEERFPDYEELMVLDRDGETLATSADQPHEVHLPPGWLARVAADQVVMGDGFFDEQLGQRLMTVAIPITAPDRSFLGTLVAHVTYRPVLTILLVFAPGDSGDLSVIARDGSLIVGIGADERSFAERRFSPANAELLLANEGNSVTFTDRDGNEVIGSSRRVPRLDWAVVAEIAADEAYAQVEQLRDLTVLFVVGLLVAVGFTAYWLGLLIVRPLDRLTAGAVAVAEGDLTVDLPVGKGEIGYLTEVFNGMVSRLREGRQQLERLAVTDALTGLANRRHLVEALEAETLRSGRSETSCSILMADVDHFKFFNDTYGHLAGDEALKLVARVMLDVVREVDFVARYGGEEFLIILPDTGIDGAVLVAERLRGQLADHGVPVGKQAVPLTVSIGVSEFPADGDSSDALIASADEALYAAKAGGRNRVVRATRGTAGTGEWAEREAKAKAKRKTGKNRRVPRS